MLIWTQLPKCRFTRLGLEMPKESAQRCYQKITSDLNSTYLINELKKITKEMSNWLNFKQRKNVTLLFQCSIGCINPKRPNSYILQTCKTGNSKTIQCYARQPSISTQEVIQTQDWNLHINCILFLCIHICIAIISLKSSKELLGLGCCSPLTPSLGEYLHKYKRRES